jgi:hypothetical protein
LQQRQEPLLGLQSQLLPAVLTGPRPLHAPRFTIERPERQRCFLFFDTTFRVDTKFGNIRPLALSVAQSSKQMLPFKVLVCILAFDRVFVNKTYHIGGCIFYYIHDLFHGSRPGGLSVPRFRNTIL